MTRRALAVDATALMEGGRTRSSTVGAGRAGLAGLVRDHFIDRAHLIVTDPSGHATAGLDAVAQQLGIGRDQVHVASSVNEATSTIRRLRTTHLVHADPEVHTQVGQVPIRVLCGTGAPPLVPSGHPLAAVQGAADLASAVEFLAMTVRGSLPDDLPRDLEVVALSAPEARVWNKSWHPDVVISIVGDPDDAVATSAEQLIVCCGDVAAGFDAFREAQAWTIVSFLRLMSPGNRVLVHCRAGVGRSTAVAAAVRVAAGMAPGDAILDLLTQRPQARPNPHILGVFDTVLGCGGELTRAADLLTQPWKPGVRHP